MQSFGNAPSAGSSRSGFLAQSGMIAAVYASFSILSMIILQGLSWGPVQFRVSEALCCLAVLCKSAIPGLSLGCFLANLAGIAVCGSGLAGLFDVFFGSLATYLGARFSWHFRSRPKLALLGPVLSNALIVPAYLPLVLQGYGIYAIPFTQIAVSDAYLPLYLFGFLFTALGEAVVLYGLGLPLMRALQAHGLFKEEER